MATDVRNEGNMARPRILHVAESARGGVGTYLAELLPEQVREFGAEHVRALVPAGDTAHVSGVDRHLIIPYRRVGRSLVALFALLFALRRQVALFRPSVIHAHSSFAGLVVRVAYGWQRRDRRPAIVYCAHGWGFDRTGRSLLNRIAAAIETRLVSWCDRIVVISEHERSRAIEQGIAADRLRLVLNGIADAPLPVPAHWDDDRLKLLFVGRLDRQKGIDVLLDAVEPLADRVALRIVGKAVADAEIDRRLSRQIEYLGWRSLAEVSAEMPAADIVVVPSRWEGFGLVAVEAMRAGRAVVASRVGGLSEIVVDGVTGRLVTADSPLELLRALSSGSRDAWRRMGRAGRQRYLDRFTAARMATDVAAVYAEVDAETSYRPAPLPRAKPELRVATGNG